MTRVAAWGDSITWGAWDNEYGGWVHRLGHRPDLQVINLGALGHKVADVADRFEREASEHRPDVVILAVGINDTPHLHHPHGTPPEKFQASYATLLDKAMNVSRTIVIGLTDVDDEHPLNRGYRNEAIRPYDELLRLLSGEFGVEYVGLAGVLTHEDLAVDGLHPKERGHAKIAERVSPVLHEALAA